MIEQKIAAGFDKRLLFLPFVIDINAHRAHSVCAAGDDFINPRKDFFIKVMDQRKFFDEKKSWFSAEILHLQPVAVSRNSSWKCHSVDSFCVEGDYET